MWSTQSLYIPTPVESAVDRMQENRSACISRANLHPSFPSEFSQNKRGKEHAACLAIAVTALPITEL